MKPDIKPFFEELLLYSGQFALFYIVMQLIIEGWRFFSNFGHVTLLFSVILQAGLLAVLGSAISIRLTASFLVPAVYSGIELLEGQSYFLNAAHIGFWIYALISVFFMVTKKRGSGPSRFAEISLVLINITLFIFLYFYFDTWKDTTEKDLLTIRHIFVFIPAFLADPTHGYVIFGGLRLALTVALGRYEIAGLKDRLYVLFSQYVDRQIRDTIIANRTITSRCIQLCILFSDIRNFTALCENNDPGAITDIGLARSGRLWHRMPLW